MTAVHIHDIAASMREPEMLAACLERVHKIELADVSIFSKPRELSGWLEWSIDIHYRTGGKLFLGVIQRKKKNKYEFCS